VAHDEVLCNFVQKNNQVVHFFYILVFSWAKIGILAPLS